MPKSARVLTTLHNHKPFAPRKDRTILYPQDSESQEHPHPLPVSLTLYEDPCSLTDSHIFQDYPYSHYVSSWRRLYLMTPQRRWLRIFLHDHPFWYLVFYVYTISKNPFPCLSQNLYPLLYPLRQPQDSST